MRTLLSVIVICLQSSVAIAAEPRDELYKLAAHEAWLELSIRLETTPIAGRDAEWQALAEQAAVGVLVSVERRGEAFGGVMLAEAFLTKFPTLKTSAAFMNKRERLRIALTKVSLPQP
jgi:hypothetical protein